MARNCLKASSLLVLIIVVGGMLLAIPTLKNIPNACLYDIAQKLPTNYSLQCHYRRCSGHPLCRESFIVTDCHNRSCDTQLTYAWGGYPFE